MVNSKKTHNFLAMRFLIALTQMRKANATRRRAIEDFATNFALCAVSTFRFIF